MLSTFPCKCTVICSPADSVAVMLHKLDNDDNLNPSSVWNTELADPWVVSIVFPCAEWLDFGYNPQTFLDPHSTLDLELSSVSSRQSLRVVGFHGFTCGSMGDITELLVDQPLDKLQWLTTCEDLMLNLHERDDTVKNFNR